MVGLCLCMRCRITKKLRTDIDQISGFWAEDKPIIFSAPSPGQKIPKSQILDYSCALIQAYAYLCFRSVKNRIGSDSITGQNFRFDSNSGSRITCFRFETLTTGGNGQFFNILPVFDATVKNDSRLHYTGCSAWESYTLFRAAILCVENCSGDNVWPFWHHAHSASTCVTDRQTDRQTDSTVVQQIPRKAIVIYMQSAVKINLYTADWKKIIFNR